MTGLRDYRGEASSAGLFGGSAQSGGVAAMIGE
jgi:hypothetical protein